MFAMSDNFFFFRRLRGKQSACVCSWDTSIVTDLTRPQISNNLFPPNMGVWETCTHLSWN